MTKAATSRVDQTGICQRMGPVMISSTVPKRVCRENQMAKLRITPTTAAVTAESAVVSDLLPRKYSM